LNIFGRKGKVDARTLCDRYSLYEQKRRDGTERGENYRIDPPDPSTAAKTKTEAAKMRLHKLAAHQNSKRGTNVFEEEVIAIVLVRLKCLARKKTNLGGGGVVSPVFRSKGGSSKTKKKKLLQRGGSIDPCQTKGKRTRRRKKRGGVCESCQLLQRLPRIKKGESRGKGEDNLESASLVTR